jgi:uncharacterized protein YlaI
VYHYKTKENINVNTHTQSCINTTLAEKKIKCWLCHHRITLKLFFTFQRLKSRQFNYRRPPTHM